MLLQIAEILNPAQLAKIEEIIQQSSFVDGRLTAGKHAARLKNNQELKADEQRMSLLARIVMSSIGQNANFRNAVLPFKVSDPIVARYTPGMTYGDHVDDPIMGTSGPKFRSDVSMTIFLRDPDSYEGGELVIRTPFGENKVKLPAGHAVIYPSSSLHRVAEVSAGERMVLLCWTQSFVKDAARRELLYELNNAREALMQQQPDTDISDQVDRSYANLLRMWSEL
ncbi:MAG: Fe2+-dependent dioxygenase [gamma proteobacterium symbiont of Bathyaustriella thionipta]|nr:Fe2+-dependent dioxygenase [gamma proteobacterium symbiont of Bathyaustriella thionipta]